MNKKKFIIPEAELVVFNNDDVIATSSMRDGTDEVNWEEGGGIGENFR